MQGTPFPSRPSPPLQRPVPSAAPWELAPSPLPPLLSPSAPCTEALLPAQRVRVSSPGRGAPSREGLGDRFRWGCGYHGSCTRAARCDSQSAPSSAIPSPGKLPAPIAELLVQPRSCPGHCQQQAGALTRSSPSCPHLAWTFFSDTASMLTPSGSFPGPKSWPSRKKKNVIWKKTQPES